MNALQLLFACGSGKKNSMPISFSRKDSRTYGGDAVGSAAVDNGGSLRAVGGVRGNSLGQDVGGDGTGGEGQSSDGETHDECRLWNV